MYMRLPGAQSSSHVHYIHNRFFPLEIILVVFSRFDFYFLSQLCLFSLSVRFLFFFEKDSRLYRTSLDTKRNG